MNWAQPPCLTPALPLQESLFPARVVYDLLFFFIVIIIVLNLIFGVIIDTFADLRSEKQKKEEILKTTCFICGEAPVPAPQGPRRGWGSRPLALPRSPWPLGLTAPWLFAHPTLGENRTLPELGVIEGSGKSLRNHSSKPSRFTGETKLSGLRPELSPLPTTSVLAAGSTPRHRLSSRQHLRDKTLLSDSCLPPGLEGRLRSPAAGPQPPWWRAAALAAGGSTAKGRAP